MKVLYLLIKYIIYPVPWLIMKISLLIYGIIITRNITTKSRGLFKIYNKLNVEVGNNCCFHTGVIIQGYRKVKIEDSVVFSPGCVLMDSGYDMSKFISEGQREHIESFICIKRRAWIGARAVILSGVTIGEFAVVGAGSVVTRDVEAYTVVAGNPARPIRRLDTSMPDDKRQ